MEAISRTIESSQDGLLPPEEVLVSKRIFQSLDGDSDGLINKSILVRTQLWQRLPCHSLVDRQNAPDVLIRQLGADGAGNTNIRHWLDLMQLIYSKSRPDYCKITYYLKNQCHQLTQTEESRARDIFNDLVSSQDEGAFDFIPLQSSEMVALCGLGSIDQILGTDVLKPGSQQCDAEFSESQWLAFCLAIKRHNGSDYLASFLLKAQATVGLTTAQSREVLCIFNALDPHSSGAINYRRLVELSPETFSKLHPSSPLPDGAALPDIATSSWPVTREEFIGFFEQMKRTRGPTFLQLTLETLVSIPEIEHGYARFEQQHPGRSGSAQAAPAAGRGCVTARGCNPGKCVVM